MSTPLTLEPRIAPDIINSRYSTCEEMNEDCLNLIISHARKKDGRNCLSKAILSSHQERFLKHNPHSSANHPSGLFTCRMTTCRQSNSLPTTTSPHFCCLPAPSNSWYFFHSSAFRTCPSLSLCLGLPFPCSSAWLIS